jgi:hypothetical protein
MPLSRGKAPGVLAGGRFTGRWRYDRTAERGIALTYDRMRRTSAPWPPDVHAGGRFRGRWRYIRAARPGIALSYDGSQSPPPAPSPARPEPIALPPTHSPIVRVLCSCGELFTFEGEGGICPGCSRPAEWPTMGLLEREMRSDLEELLQIHEHGADPD